MNDFQQLVQQLQQFWARQGAAGRVGYGAAVAALVAAVAGVTYWVNRTEYAPLYSGLATEQMAAISRKLDEERISYKLSMDGTSIQVPSDRVQKTRMVLAGAGLTQGTEKGYELFDNMSIGASPDQFNMNRQRAIQGELAKSIMTLEAVQHAHVMIAQPDPTPFLRDEKPATASVMIKTRPGMTLSRQGADAIIALVVGSVRGMQPENVTVVDTAGRTLSEKKKSANGMASNEQLAHQLEVESHLTSKAQEILTRLVGPGRAVVRVTADMTFRHVKESSDKYDPEARVALRELAAKSKTSPSAPARGPAGTTSNLPPVSGNTPNNSAASSNDEEMTEFAVSRVQRSHEEQQENINRLTVAVMLIPPKPVDEVSLKEQFGITETDAAELVKQAIGFKSTRGDQVQVSVGKPTEFPMIDPSLDKELISVQQWQNIGSALKASSLGIAALSLLAIGLLSMRRKPSPTPSPAMSMGHGDLEDLHAVAGTIRAWIEETPTLRMDQSPVSKTGKA